MKNMGRQSRVRAVGLVKLLVCICIEITHNTNNFITYSMPSPWQQRQNKTQLPGTSIFSLAAYWLLRSSLS